MEPQVYLFFYPIRLQIGMIQKRFASYTTQTLIAQPPSQDSVGRTACTAAAFALVVLF